MTYLVGKFLELNGMVVLAVGLAWGLFGADVKGEIMMLGLGAVVFLAGYFLERRKPR